MTPPHQARIVVVVGGIAGCAVACHFAALGQRDVLLLEQGRLAGAWHAAGLVGQVRASRAMTAMSLEGIGLYGTLEAEIGLATGREACGSLAAARASR